jgi:predicted dehydrogenase
MTGKENPLRIAVIGAGEMSAWAILPALHFAPLELRAICDLDEDRAKEAATKFGTGHWYTDYREMWGSEDIEAVIVQMNPQPRQQVVLEAAGCVTGRRPGTGDGRGRERQNPDGQFPAALQLRR